MAAREFDGVQILAVFGDGGEHLVIDLLGLVSKLEDHGEEAPLLDELSNVGIYQRWYPLKSMNGMNDALGPMLDVGWSCS